MFFYSVFCLVRVEIGILLEQNENKMVKKYFLRIVQENWSLWWGQKFVVRPELSKPVYRMRLLHLAPYNTLLGERATTNLFQTKTVKVASVVTIRDRGSIQSGLRMGGDGILWILCLAQILRAGALPMSGDKDLAAEGLQNTECANLRY